MKKQRKHYTPEEYTNGMKTAISIPDEVYEGAERLARRTKKSGKSGKSG